MHAELNSEIHGDRRGAHATLRAHHRDQFVCLSSIRLRDSWVKRRSISFNASGFTGFGDKVLHATAHGI